LSAASARRVEDLERPTSGVHVSRRRDRLPSGSGTGTIGSWRRLEHAVCHVFAMDRSVSRFDTCLRPDGMGASAYSQRRSPATAGAYPFACFRTRDTRHAKVHHIQGMQPSTARACPFTLMRNARWATSVGSSPPRDAFIDSKEHVPSPAGESAMRGMGASVTFKGCPRQPQGHVISR
jgi:hypothetical protein